MKRLLTLSVLLLFSVDVFAQEQVCLVKGNISADFDWKIRRSCEDADILSLTGILGETPRIATFRLNVIASWFCDFDKEIIMNSDDTNAYLICALNDHEPRVVYP